MVRLTRRGGAPLSLYVAKYFAYAIVLIVALWVACFAALSAAMNAGLVYPANWGAANAREVAESLRTEDPFDPQSVPTAFRYALFDTDGNLVSTDMDGGELDHSREIALGGAPVGEVEVLGSSGATYAAFGLGDGTSCVLVSTYMPQFVSPELRDSLPNPQNIMLAAGLVGSLAAVVLVAGMAGRFVARKLAPLTDAAARVARQDLEFSVERGGVREVNEVLAAMDAMRGSLKESLEARWDAERRQRDQVAALAHDLKTPLTVIRANAEYVAEEVSELAAGARSADSVKLGAVADAALAAVGGTQRLDSYVRLLIDASRGLCGPGHEVPADADELSSLVEADGSSLARAAGIGFGFSSDEGLAGLWVGCDGDSLLRAVMNVVSNAVEHASGRVSVAVRPLGEAFLEIEVVDDGAGFSEEALERGCERFFRGDPSRSEGHCGLGLYTAAQTVRACGGALEISNLDPGGTADRGARVVIRVPVVRGR